MKVQDAKRQQQDRELQTQQEEEERLLRKKVGVRRLTRAMGVRKAGLLIRCQYVSTENRGDYEEN